MPYVKTFGEALAEGLAGATGNYLQTQNTLQQQALAQQNIEADKAFRSQEADRQQAERDRAFKYQRDSDAYRHIDGQRTELVQLFAQGAFAKDPLLQDRAKGILQQMDKLKAKISGGQELSPEEMASYDQLYGDFAGVVGLGAGNVGQDVAAGRAAQVAGQQAGARVAGVQANVAEGTQGAQIASAGSQAQTEAANAQVAAGTVQPRIDAATAGARTAGVQANVAAGTEGAQIRAGNAQADSAELGVDLARFQLGDLKTKAPLVYQGMQLSNAGAQQALDFDAEANPQRLEAFKLQNGKTRQEIDQSADLFPWQKKGLIADVNVKEAQADIVAATKAGTISRQNAESFGALAQTLRDPAAFDGLVKDGVLTEAQAKPFRTLATYYRDAGQAQLDQARAQATGAQSAARVAVGTEGAQIDTAKNQAATTGAQAQVAQGTVGAQITNANNQAAISGSEAQVAAGTVAPRIQAAQSGAQTAAAQATSAGAQAQVDVATIPAMIQSRQVGVQQAQAALTAQLQANRFTDATFQSRVAALDLSNAKDRQTLLDMKRSYEQQGAKFPTELAYLKAQTAVMTAQAENLVLTGSKTGQTGGKSSTLEGLKQLRMTTADDLRVARANVARVVQQYIPNAKFSVDKYDSKAFSTLVQSNANLSPEAKQELAQAQVSLDAVLGKNNALQNAFATVASGKKLTPGQLAAFGVTDDTAPDPGAPPRVGTKPATFTGQKAFDVSRVAGNLGIDPNDLAAVISFETGGSFDPAKKNPGYTDKNGVFHPSTATGLIQFIDSTARGLGTSSAALGKMTFGQQMVYVEKYLKGRGIGPGSSLADIYNAVLGTQKGGTPASGQAAGMDVDGNGMIDPSEAVRSPAFAGHIRDYYATPGPQGPTKPAAAPPSTPQLASQPVPKTAAPQAQPKADTSPASTAPPGGPQLGGKPLTYAAKLTLNSAITSITAKLPQVGNDPTKKRNMLTGIAIPVAEQLGRQGYQVSPAQVLGLINSSGGQAFK